MTRYLLLFLTQFISALNLKSSTCFCTIVPCPISGTNYLTLQVPLVYHLVKHLNN